MTHSLPKQTARSRKPLGAGERRVAIASMLAEGLRRVLERRGGEAALSSHLKPAALCLDRAACSDTDRPDAMDRKGEHR
jgi:hypothetical protein